MQWISDSIKSLFSTTDSEERDSLQRDGVLTKEQLRKFFKAGYKMFDSEDVKKNLKEAAAKRKNVGWMVTELQKQIFESQGVDGKFGIEFLAKIRQTYGDDAEFMEELMNFVDREELVLDEAELPMEKFTQKLQMRQYAMEQMKSMREQLRNMSPEEQMQFMREQQTMMKHLNEQHKEICQKAEDLPVEERKKYIMEQMQQLRDQLSLSRSCAGEGGQPVVGEPSMGPVMTPDEQVSFFRSLNKSKQ